MPSSPSGTLHRPGTTTPRCADAPETEELLYIDPDLCITRLQRPRSCLLRLNGEIDVTKCAAIADLLARAGQQEGQVIIDAARLTFADTAGLRMLSTAATQHGLLVRNVPHQVGRLLALLSLPTLP